MVEKNQPPKAKLAIFLSFVTVSYEDSTVHYLHAGSAVFWHFLQIGFHNFLCSIDSGIYCQRVLRWRAPQEGVITVYSDVHVSLSVLLLPPAADGSQLLARDYAGHMTVFMVRDAMTAMSVRKPSARLPIGRLDRRGTASRERAALNGPRGASAADRTLARMRCAAAPPSELC